MSEDTATPTASNGAESVTAAGPGGGAGAHKTVEDVHLDSAPTDPGRVKSGTTAEPLPADALKFSELVHARYRDTTKEKRATNPEPLTAEALQCAEFILAREGYPTTSSIADLSPRELDEALDAGFADERNTRMAALEAMDRHTLQVLCVAEAEALKSEMGRYLPKLTVEEMQVYGCAKEWSFEQALALAHRVRPQAGLLDWLGRNWTLHPKLGELMRFYRLMRLAGRERVLSNPVVPAQFLGWAKLLKRDFDHLDIAPTLEGLSRKRTEPGDASTGSTDRLLNTAQVCERMGISPNTLRKRERLGQVPSSVGEGRVRGQGKKWRESDIEYYLASQRLELSPGAEPAPPAPTKS